MPTAPPHYLRRNTAETSPHNVLAIGLATSTTYTASGSIDRLARWHVSTADRNETTEHTTVIGDRSGSTASDLADVIIEATHGRRCLWIFVWSTMRLITLTMLPGMLAERGWTLSATGMGAAEPTVTMMRGRSTIVIAPLRSWVGGNPWQMTQKLAMQPLPAGIHKDSPEYADASAEAERTAILDAVMAILEWWDRLGLGHWRKTGPSCGWGAARHTLTDNNRILIDPDPERCALDRAAIYGGSRLTTRHGRQTDGHYTLFDIAHAHATAMASCLLPVARKRSFVGKLPKGVKVLGHEGAVIGDVTVRTETPRYPVRHQGHIYYPIGTFRTVLAGPDLAYAEAHGDLVEWHGGTIHRLGTAMQRFGRWLVSELDKPDADLHPAVRATIKSWSRSVPGKFAAHGSTTRILSTAVPGECWALNGSTSRGGQSCGTLAIGGKVIYTELSGEGQNSYPAVLAFIESYVRCALFDAIGTVGFASVVQADTDGMIVDLDSLPRDNPSGATKQLSTRAATATAANVADALVPITEPFTMRIKASTDVLWVTGPQHYEGRSVRKASGVAGGAHPGVGGNALSLRTPTLHGQIERGYLGGMIRRDTVASWPKATAPGWCVYGGRVMPPTAHVNTSGVTVLESWDQTRWRTMGYVAEPDQSPTIKALNRPPNPVRPKAIHYDDDMWGPPIKGRDTVISTV